MLQYLLNATTIWLVCLLVYDLFLSKETYHAYNRVYLNVSLVLGLLLPLWHWNKKSAVITNDTVIQSAAQASNIRQTIVNTILEPAAVLNVYSIVWFLYLIGVAIAAVFIAKELNQIIRYYRNGNKSKTANFTIVETGKEHSPFSLFKTIYVRSRQEFTDEQWALLMTHEMQHGKLMHSLDKCFLLLLRIVLWFHPLVYLYYRRMMIVHEYQADAPSKEKAGEYGSFLLEQSLLQQAPIIVHSFNYSPIKNRISMLTRKNSSKIKLTKYLLAIPLTVGLLVCCTNYGFSTDKEKKEGKIYFKGNVFETNESHWETTLKANGHHYENGGWQSGNKKGASKRDADTMTVDSKNLTAPDGKRITNATLTQSLLKMNGKDIVNSHNVTSMPKLNNIIPFDELIYKTLKPELDKLEDGDNYMIIVRHMIVDENGKLVYYDIGDIAQFFYHIPTGNEKSIDIDAKIKDAINTKLTALFESDLRFTPATVDGKPVISFIYPFKGRDNFSVKDHVSTLVHK